ncbi:hypothetical protein GmHk_18G053016 [Glycine max]|nr:hypothetical protein GmHk_18G053016 [Glycine max]
MSKKNFKATSTNVSKTITTFRRQQTQYPLNCFNGGMTYTCPKDYYPTKLEQDQDSSTASTCPEYFKWIHEDLKPWKRTGITREMMERGRNVSYFRLVIKQGKAYAEMYADSYETRDVFTIWGILQLLRAELAIKPWEALLQNIDEGNKKIKWKDRLPYAFWKGNTWVSHKRNDLTKCNASDQHDSYAQIHPLLNHWDKEIAQGFQNTKLEDQCMHSLVPRQHYWPISSNNQSMCNDIKYVVEWGNANPDKAEAIGKAGTNFIEENLKMKFVYDYMFHLLTEYARLLSFEPTIPAGAVEICSENLACPKNGLGWSIWLSPWSSHQVIHIHG